MEADWEIEIGRDAPVIEPHWPGFIDLRVTPAAAHQLPECADFNALAELLIQLNSTASPIWTAKCDLWTVDELDSYKFDPYELDAPLASTHVQACYVDLLPASKENSSASTAWSTPEQTIEWCKALCTQLKSVALRSCRVDLVIRRACLTLTPALDHALDQALKREEHGLTAYFMGCGASESEAKDALKQAFRVFAQKICTKAPAATLK